MLPCDIEVFVHCIRYVFQTDLPLEQLGKCIYFFTMHSKQYVFLLALRGHFTVRQCTWNHFFEKKYISLCPSIEDNRLFI